MCDFIFVSPASILTPSSSGRGDERIMPAKMNKRYVLVLANRFVDRSLFISTIGFVFLNLLNSSINENLIILNMNKSDSIAPNPPTKEARYIFSGISVKKKPIANGVENPKEKNIPAIKIPK